MTDKPIKKAVLALGSNLGDRLAALRAARAALAPYVVVTATSHVYETKALYAADQPTFLNAALVGETTLEPQALLYTVKEIERSLGREPTYRYGPRAIDIDIIFYEKLQLRTQELTIPHTLLAERSFVLSPLRDIAPDWVHPGTGATVLEMLAALPPGEDVRDTGEIL
ncbi:MAG: 2-amino-4-hydroxy-6-hydroxymethyldihydropteridine diphosphokinase [Alphaproteobacteria bacterium]|nr:2-amino-4-hydroxy-6-hydroxymethyldihydropteridine diphosphokinase [Alphaproteobacteria bacterium]